MMRKTESLTEVQKAADNVRFARTKFAIYGGDLAELELVAALVALEKAQALEARK